MFTPKTSIILTSEQLAQLDEIRAVAKENKGFAVLANVNIQHNDPDLGLVKIYYLNPRQAEVVNDAIKKAFYVE